MKDRYTERTPYRYREFNSMVEGIGWEMAQKEEVLYAKPTNLRPFLGPMWWREKTPPSSFL